VGFLSTHDYILRLLEVFPKSFVVLKEDLYSYMTGYVTERNHFLYELADETIQKLVTGGVLEHGFNIFNYADILAYKVFHHLDYVKESNVLTLEDFSYGFTLWIIACLICILAFLMELTTFYIKMDPFYHIKNFIGIFALLNALTFYNNNYCGDLGIGKGLKLTQEQRELVNHREITPNNYRNRNKMTRIGKVFLEEYYT